MTSIPTDITVPRAVPGALGGVPDARPRPTVPTARPGRRPGLRPADRRDGRRPTGRAGTAALPAARPAVGGGGCAPGVPREVAIRRRRVAASVVLATLLAALVGAAVLLTGTAGPGGAGGPVPERVTVTVVGAGETLSDIARRSAPSAEVSATVERIRALNALPGSALSVGRPLAVPAG